MKFSRALRLGALTLTAALTLAGCGLFAGKGESPAENLDKLYAEARDDVASGSFSIYHYQGDKLLAVDSVNAAKDHLQARKLLDAGVSPTAEQAADQAFDLSTLLVK